MSAIKAVWTNGQILPSEPVDWPEGSALRVEPLDETPSLADLEGPNDAAAIAEWIAAVEALPTMRWAEGEEEEFERWRQEMKRFNIEAVRRQMAAADGAAP